MGTVAEFTREQKEYRSVFVGTAPPPPWPCHFCGLPVDPADADARWKFVVHHIDHDRTNPTPDNLAPAHFGCHQRYHAQQQWARARAEGKRVLGEYSPEAMAAWAERMKAAGAKHHRRLREDPAYRAAYGRKISESFTDEHRAKTSATIRATNARRYRCGGCDLVTAPGALGNHQRVTGHTGRRRVS